jgi:hypothetical protein
MADRATKVNLESVAEVVINPATDDTLKQILGFDVPVYDSITLTYVSAGNGAGEIETVVYKNGLTTVATLTLAYNSDDKLSTVTKS